MAVAKKYLPRVGIETPMTPEFYATFLRKKDRILATGIDSINCAELRTLNETTLNYAGEPLYMYRQGYISPIWSRELDVEVHAHRRRRGLGRRRARLLELHKICPSDLNLRAKEWRLV